MNNYQAIYDATLRALDPGNIFAVIQQEFCIAAQEIQRPSVLFKPKIFMDGGKWCVLYGENLQDGICAFGSTPANAMGNFDEVFHGRKAIYPQDDEK